MVFSSIFFLFHFLPLFFLVYHVTPHKFRNYVILLASLFFYSWGAPAFVFVLTGAIIINFFVVQKLSRTGEAYPRKALLILSLGLNLGLLAYFKYANFFVDNVNQVLSVFGAGQIEWIRVALPIGISFFTFQSITYSVDVYRKNHTPFEKLSNYMLYIISFPQMIAGPIVRYREIADEIIHREERIDDKLIGFYRFIIGLAKKVLIANVMAEQAEQIFSHMDGLTTPMAWVGVLAYTMQIYFDFSGYSDMAIGLGKIMGLHFPENFNSPYISKSITEFWRRWHITLGTFMKEYLYIPLGGNRVTRSRLFFNLCFVFVLSGLWHGASWNFVIWGAFHGFFLVLDRLFLKKVLDYLPGIVSLGITFFITMIGWVFFRFEDTADMIRCFQALFSFNLNGTVEVMHSFYPVLVLALLFSFMCNFSLGKKLERYFFESTVFSIRGHLFQVVISMSLLILSASYLATSGFNPFIYFRF